MYKNLSPRALGFTTTVQSEIIELSLSHGFKGIDVDIVEFASDAESYGLDQARRLIDSARLKVGNFVLPTRWLAEEPQFKSDLVDLKRYAELSAEIGCTRALTVMPSASDERPYHENFEFHTKRLNEVGNVLGEHGVSLAVEFCGPAHLRKDRAFEFVHDLDAALTLIKMVAAKNVGLLVDTWHLHTSGGSMEDIRKIPAERIVSVQIADAPTDVAQEDYQNDTRCLPGETGVVDCAAALTILAEMGYDGPVTPEPLNPRLDGMGRAGAVSAVAKALDEVWQSAGLSPSGKLMPSESPTN